MKVLPLLLGVRAEKMASSKAAGLRGLGSRRTIHGEGLPT